MPRTLAIFIALMLCSSPALFSQTPAKLAVGSPAPELKVEKWLKGSPVTSFEKGKVYLVEFWSTWCGPSMPHLSAMQKEYKDKGLTVIGTNVREENYDDTTLANVEKFVAKNADRMNYTVAYDGKAKESDASYLQAAGIGGIPASFIIDQKGVIAWIGDTKRADFALGEVMNGIWDTKTGPEREKKMWDELLAVEGLVSPDPEAAQAAFDKFAASYPRIANKQNRLKLALMRANGQWDKFYAALGVRADEAIENKDSAVLNEIAWTIVDPNDELEKRDVELAMRAATKAEELTEGKDPAILDTLARCYATKGDYAKALEIQTKAYDMATGYVKSDLEESLDEYKEKAGK